MMPNPSHTHCDNCGLTWLDDGLNPLRCPYCTPKPAAPNSNSLEIGGIKPAAPAVPEEWLDVLIGLVNIADAKGTAQGSPNHRHSKPGIWDPDNRPELRGKPCAECAVYDRARAILKTTGAKP